MSQEFTFSENSSESPSWLVRVRTKCSQQDYQGALEDLLQIDPHEPQYDLALQMQARCFLATSEHSKAEKAYQSLLKQTEDLSLQVEAFLVLGEIHNAVKTLQKIKTASHPDYTFLAALAFYRYGYIQQAMRQIEHARNQGFEWQEESLIDAVAQTVLSGSHFFDFEQIYLDSKVSEQDEQMNRWFHLNIPVIELLSSTQGDPQIKKAVQLAKILGAPQGVIEKRNGRLFLSEIINDLAASQVDARFGLEAKKIMQKDDYKELAQLVLALLLEHTQQFAAIIGIETKDVPQFDLQNLVLVLPLRMATAILILYALAEKESTQLLVESNRLDKDIVAGLIGMSFESYYAAVNRYRSIQGGGH